MTTGNKTPPKATLANHLAKASKAASERRGRIVAEYKKLLEQEELSESEASRLLAAAEELGRSTIDIKVDQDMLSQISQAEREAADIPQLKAALRQAGDARTAEWREIDVAKADLQRRIDQIDFAVNDARRALERANDSARWLTELRAKWSDTFDQPAPKTEAKPEAEYYRRNAQMYPDGEPTPEEMERRALTSLRGGKTPAVD